MTLPRVARVTYSYNQSLEDAGRDGYFLDFYIVKADGSLIDRRETFSSRDKFLEALEQVIPTLSMPEPVEEVDPDEELWQAVGIYGEEGV